jgi:3-hydroxyisobutyrate dehydrogenase-like beta-hydroxyacid dehydrogenase
MSERFGPPVPVTIIGLGAMGTALAGAYLAAGHPTTVWNRTPGRADDLVARGAVELHEVAGAVAASPLVIVCVLDYPAVREVLDPIGAVLSGRVLVNLTNGTPAQARETATWAANRGADYLDGGIMAVPPGIGTPAAFLLYSGSEQAFTAYRRELDLLGAASYLGTDPGLAALHDLALLTGMYGMFAGFVHAFALVGSEKIRATEFASLLAPWLHAMLSELPRWAERIDTGDHTTAVVSNLAMQATAFPNLIQVSRDQGVRPDLMVGMQALLDRALSAGHGDADLTVLVELLTAPQTTKGTPA